MDHSWNQLNQFNQQYQRLAAAATNSVAANPRLDFPQAFLEQTAALATPGKSLICCLYRYCFRTCNVKGVFTRNKIFYSKIITARYRRVSVQGWGGGHLGPVLCLGGFCPEGGLSETPLTVKSRWYTSYWNAFLFIN